MTTRTFLPLVWLVALMPPEHAAGGIACVGGEWGVQGGQLRQTSTRGGAFAFFRKQVYADVVLSFRFRVDGTGEGVRAAGALVRSRDSESFYGVHFDTRNGQVVLYASPWHGRPDWTVLARKAIALQEGRWYSAR